MERFVPRPQRLFEDEIVLDLLPPSARFVLRVPPIRAAFVALVEAAAPGVRGALLCRTRRIDDAVRDALHRGLAPLVILGAGLDTRAYRLAELADTKVLEIDLPAVQEYKKAALQRRFGKLPSPVRFVPIDFNVERLDAALERGGLDRSERAIFVWEGVSQYLQPDAVDAVLRTVAERPDGTELVFTYVVEAAITGRLVHRPEPWYFGIDRARLREFLAERGLTLRHDFGAEEHRADYLRPLGRQLEVSELERVSIAAV
jgi:methyltransferase (TIGR00027 family)